MATFYYSNTSNFTCQLQYRQKESDTFFYNLNITPTSSEEWHHISCYSIRLSASNDFNKLLVQKSTGDPSSFSNMSTGIIYTNTIYIKITNRTYTISVQASPSSYGTAYINNAYVGKKDCYYEEKITLDASISNTSLYKFSGWKLNNSIISTDLHKQIQVYQSENYIASFALRPTYDVDFNSNGGSPTYNSQRIKEGDTVSSPGDVSWSPDQVVLTASFMNDVAPSTSIFSARDKHTYKNYTFGGWSPSLPRIINAATTFTAQKLSGSVDPVDVPTPSGNPTKNGYDFDGWDNPPATMTSNVTIYPKWKAKETTIRVYYKDSKIDGDDLETYQEFNISYNQQKTISLPSKVGYKTPTNVLDANGNARNLTITGDLENHEYYAIYTRYTNTVVLNLNVSDRSKVVLNGSNKDLTLIYTIKDPEINIRNKYIPIYVDGNTTYCFLGWWTAPTGGLEKTKIVPSEETNWNTTTTYYAHWLPLSRYIYKDGAWHGILNMWVWVQKNSNENGNWVGGITDPPNEYYLTNTTVYTWVKDKDNKWKWKKEKGGRL